MKFKKYQTVLLFILLAICHIATAQQIAFYKQYSAHKLAFNSIATVHDGGCIVAGGDLWGPNGGNFIFLKTDIAGNEAWRGVGTYFLGSQDSSNVFHDVIETNDHKFIMCGELTTYSPYMTHNLILEVDSLGGILWSKLETMAYPVTAYHLTEVSNGDFFTVGNIQDSISKVFIEKHSANGDTIWTRTISFFPYPALGLRIVAQGSFLYASGQLFDSLSTGNSWAFLAKLDTSGNLISSLELIDSVSINPRGLNVFDSIIYLQTIKSFSAGQVSWIPVFDTSLNQINDFDFPTMETCTFIDNSRFLGALSGITFYKGDSFGDSIWSCMINEPDGRIRAIAIDSAMCGFACGAINDGVTSVGLIVKICDSLGNSINESEISQNVAIIYPNPSTKMVTIKISSNTYENECFQFKLFDIANHIIYSNNEIFVGETHLNLDSLPSGVYHYSLFCKNKTQTGKLIFN